MAVYDELEVKLVLYIIDVICSSAGKFVSIFDSEDGTVETLSIKSLRDFLKVQSIEGVEVRRKGEPVAWKKAKVPMRGTKASVRANEGVCLLSLLGLSLTPDGSVSARGKLCCAYDLSWDNSERDWYWESHIKSALQSYGISEYENDIYRSLNGSGRCMCSVKSHFSNLADLLSRKEVVLLSGTDIQVSGHYEGVLRAAFFECNNGGLLFKDVYGLPQYIESCISSGEQTLSFKDIFVQLLSANWVSRNELHSRFSL